jgi:hypothetical protein
MGAIQSLKTGFDKDDVHADLADQLNRQFEIFKPTG